MDLFSQVLINSLIVGSLYGLMAMGFSLAYRTTRFFNLAHGSMAAVGGYAFIFLHDDLGLGTEASLPAAILIAGLAGFLIDRFIYAPQRERKASSAVMLVVSLGVLTVLEALISMTFSTQFRPLTAIGEIKTYPFGTTFISRTQVFMIGVNILTFASLLLILYKTKFGRMIRAISDDMDVARVLGIRTQFYIGWVFFISAGLAGLAGILTGLDTGLQPTMGFYLLLKGIIAAIIGCVSSVPGAFLGGYLLALAENMGIMALASEWRDAIAFVLLLLFLVFRPQGILGKNGE